MKSRPSLKDPSLKVQVLRRLLPLVASWAGENPEDMGVLHKYADPLADLLQSHDVQNSDGYRKAKYMEDRHGWRPDSKLVYLFDQIPHLTHQVYDQWVEEWVRDNQVVPTLDVGTTVTVDGQEGVIQSVLYKEARYQVALQDRVLGVPYEQVVV